MYTKQHFKRKKKGIKLSEHQPRAELYQRKLQIRSNHTTRRKAQVSRDGLTFEMLKFEQQVKNNDKGVELEEKKFSHSVVLEEKKWDHGINLEEKKLDWEKEEKEKYQSFEMAKLEQLASQEHIGKSCKCKTPRRD
ncbi:hypothetical protein VP01_1893g4 [Puccinia sorghi]|uniref:Uncharacterized protein n=1 Tax=Puccinia sorghi TaxID=27349 RepID=A0A0L6VCZ2_9BASI|nr:hypothetical protein VP01_1893g4 [Puccinia sorghi]